MVGEFQKGGSIDHPKYGGLTRRVLLADRAGTGGVRKGAMTYGKCVLWIEYPLLLLERLLSLFTM